MLSKALSQYPQFRFRQTQKRLWNPIVKKDFANLPEERVRLSLVDYFTKEGSVMSSRISFESPVKLVGDKSSSRTDIICYDKEFAPLLLVECKAPAIKLDEKAAVQIARYNQKVGAPYLLVSNGMIDFWFHVNEGDVQPIGEIPKAFSSGNKRETNLDYWVERSFVGTDLHPGARDFVKTICEKLFLNPAQPVKYLAFDDFGPELALGHYYRIFGLKIDQRVAISISANPYGGTRLNAVLNQDGANIAFCSASLNMIAEEENANTEIHSQKGQIQIDLREEIGFSFSKEIEQMASRFGDLLLKHS